MSINSITGAQTGYAALKSAVRSSLIIVSALLGLGACSSDTFGDLDVYVNEVKARKAGRIAPLPEVKSYESYLYSKDDLRDPFSPAVAELISDAVTGGGMQPDVQRNKEPLEAFPLDSLVFAGHLEQGGRVWAVITAPDSMVYRVEEGNYLGQNFGRISRISESQIDIREVIPNGLGGWTERDAILTLTE